MPDNASLDERVTKWLQDQGYPLEMRSAAEFRAAGFIVRQSQHYMDAESGKSRETDVVCLAKDQLGVALIRFVVECKATGKPWVVLSSPYTLDSYNRLFALGHLSAPFREVLIDLTMNDRGALSALKWFKKDGRVGFNVVQAFSKGEDAPFTAAMSVVKASLWLHEDGAKFTASFPVIVVDAPLYEGYLGEAGEILLQRVDEAEYFFGAHVGMAHPTCVRIVSKDALPRFSVSAKNEADELMRLLGPTIDIEWKKMQSAHDF